MKNILAFIFIFAMSFPAIGVAEERRLALGGWSDHFMGIKSITNETHYIVGVELKGYSVGYFKNSYGRDTFFIAKNWRWNTAFQHVNFIASAGLNRGYKTCYGDDDSNSNICPHGYIGVEYDEYRLVHTAKIVPGAIVYSPEIKF